MLISKTFAVKEVSCRGGGSATAADMSMPVIMWLCSAPNAQLAVLLLAGQSEVTRVSVRCNFSVQFGI